MLIERGPCYSFPAHHRAPGAFFIIFTSFLTYAATVVTGGGMTGGFAGSAHFLSYGDGRWWTGNEDRRIWSSTGGAWTHEFIFPNMAGSHGDGMEYVNGNVWGSIGLTFTGWLLRRRKML